MMQFDDQRVMGLISKKKDDQSRFLLQKGKRTKRQIRQKQLIMSTTCSSSCSSGGENVGFCDLSLSCGGGGGGDPVLTANSPDNSDEIAQSIIVDDVEEDMVANCLILLAQGSREEKSKSQSPLLNSKAITTDDEFECKTCNRRFPSFQALGGHRASHKKPKSEIKKVPPPENYQLHKFNNSPLSLQITRDSSSNNSKLRIHECSICGAEFTSGQALGGHMRRHRPLPVASRTTTSAAGGNIDHDQSLPQQVKKSRLEVLGLDLNLPAPEDDLRESKFLFGSKSNDQVLVFAAAASPPLVGCEY